MALYSLAQRATVTTSGNAAIDLACSSGARPRLMEMGAFLGAATASTYGLTRASALGTRTTPTALLSEEPGDPALTGINLVDQAIAWSVDPTKVATRIRRIGLPATIGVGIIWTFPRGLVVAQSLSVVLVNDATNSAALDCHQVADV